MPKIGKKIAENDSPPNMQTQFVFDAKRDLNPYWRSSLFSEVYLKNDIPREYKNIWDHDEISDETSGFFKFYNGFIDLCHDLDHEVFENWKEADTVKNWIVPIMELLGWEDNSERSQNSYMDNESFTVLEKGKKQIYRPDLIFFDKPTHKTYTQKEKDFEKKLLEARDARTGVKIVVEAKYWNRLSLAGNDKKRGLSKEDSVRGLGPELQTLKYMEIFGHDFGILTDGKTWRLFHKDLSQGMDRRSYDFDLGRLSELALSHTEYENEEKYRHYAKYFYYFFAKQSLIKTEHSKTIPFVQEVFEYSKKYAHSIEEDLKKRFIITMGIACNALKRSCDNQGEKVDLEMIRNVAESHLFQILFVKSCEVRHVLPVKSVEYVKVSLHEVVESLDAMRFDPNKDWNDFLIEFRYGNTFGGKKFSYDGYEIFNRFINLYEIIHDGTAKNKDFGFEIQGFKESTFSKLEWKFAKAHKINNRDMVQILFTLNFIESSFSGRKYQQIPYSYFTPRQLGSIYESLLEFKLDIAESDLIFKDNKWQKANLGSIKVKELRTSKNNIAKKNSLYFTPDNEDRKLTGTFYTPDEIVKYITVNSIGKQLKNLTSRELLKIRLCDPAMGSGHFLAGALEYLTHQYREKVADENNDDVSESFVESAARVLHNCLYGVDINPRAVKLAKLSLWLSTAMPGTKLEDLSDQLRSGDSLSFRKKFDWKKEFPKIFKEGGFTTVIGNPPWVSFGLRGVDKLSSEDKDRLKNIYPGSAEYKISLYSIFIDKAISLAREGGIISMIVPDSFLLGMYFSKLRKTILDTCRINELLLIKADFWGSVATGFNVIFNFEKGFQGRSKIHSVYYDGLDSLLKHDGNFCYMENDFIHNERFRFSIVFDDDVKNFVNKVKANSQRLDTIGRLRTGVRSKIGQKNIISKKREKPSFQKGIVSGASVLNYSVSWEGDFLNIDPGLLNAGGWDPDVISKRKILIRQTADTTIAGIDTNKLYHLNNCHSFVADKIDIPLEYICAILNSRMMRSFYAYISMETGRTMAQTDMDVLSGLPIRISKKVGEVEKIVKLVTEIMSDSKKLTPNQKKLDKIIENIYEIGAVPERVKAAKHFSKLEQIESETLAS